MHCFTQMSGHIKFFDDGGKNMPFKTEDDNVFLEYDEIWNKIKKTLNIKFHSQPIYDEKYIKTEVKTFDDVINTFFFRQLIDSDMKIDKNNYPQVYLEQCKYKEKRTRW